MDIQQHKLYQIESFKSLSTITVYQTRSLSTTSGSFPFTIDLMLSIAAHNMSIH